MNQLTAYLVSVGATAGLSLLVVFILVAPMKRILRDVCGTDDRGNFWTIFSCLLIVLSTLLFCLFQPPLDGSAPTTAETFSRSIATLRMGLFGLLAAIGVIAVTIIALICVRPPYDDPRNL